MPLHLQVKLLRVLQEHAYERVGDSQTRRSNARIIAATNKNLRRAVAEGQFREDLYYRLRVFPIEVPPLRERREDIEPIAQLLLSRVGTRTGRELRFSPETVRALLSHPWPGNVRELENALEFAATVCTGQTLQPEDLPREVLEGAAGLARPEDLRPALPPLPPPRLDGLAAEGAASPSADALPPGERAAVLRALEANRWNRAAAAKALGVSRSTLWRRMRAAGLE